MIDRELQHWLERNNAGLLSSDVTAALGRGPSLGAQPGATWISFQSKRGMGRVVISPGGHCQLTSSTVDGAQRSDSEEQFTSSARLDDALAVLVRGLG